MLMPSLRAIRSTFLAASTAWLFAVAAPAWPFLIPTPQPAITVVEYYNVLLDHYFLTAHPDEMAAIEAGSAGSGWSRTGWSFGAYPVEAPLPGRYCPASGCGHPVSRFYSAFSNSHFYTVDAGEAIGLQRPGGEWMLERQEFAIDAPDNAGRCAEGEVPVYRLYNNRFAFHDSNHRFVTDAGERAKMAARGWIDEGARFCALSAGQVPIKSYVMAIDLAHKIMPSADCENESENLGSCMALNNLTPPTTLYPPAQLDAMPKDFFDRTGMASSWNYVRAPLFGSPVASDAAQDVFVQNGGTALGIHVDTRNRGPSPYSSVNPLYQFHTTTTPGAFDDRFFPWAPRESEVELAVHFTLNVKTINTRGDGSAYGHPTLEFIDERSGRHLYFTVMTYGTVLLEDFLAPDVATGKAIVGTTFRASSPYIRSYGLPSLQTPSGFISPNYWGWGGYFEFRMDRDEFQRVLDAARTVDPILSPVPADYFFENFHFNNEVYGDGDIGVNMDGFTLELLRR
jgi:hypothetical protein